MDCSGQISLFKPEYSEDIQIDLHEYGQIIINSSAGKDSLVSIYEICRLADLQGYDRSNICVSHQDLGEAEWGGTKELAKEQADLFGLDFYMSKRVDKDGYEESLLEYAERRGKWPSSTQRWCTSDFKRGPGARIVTSICPASIEQKVLYVFGFRKQESPSRSKKKQLSLNKKLTTINRKVYDFLPVHNWTVEKVWQTITDNDLPYHMAYDLGMPRLSCCFCIFSPFDALVLAGIHNFDLLKKYVHVEEKINHTFKHGFAIAEVLEAIENGYVPDKLSDWIM